MLITIIKVGTPETQPTGKGRPYRKMEVLYRNSKGEVYPKILVSFKNPTVFKVLSEAKEGQEYEVENVKNEDGYFEWKSANLVTAETTGVLPQVDAKGDGVKAPVKMIVTEADRNRYIVRQSSLERAVETLSGGGVLTVKDVTDIAAQYEAWVFRPVPLSVAALEPVKQVTAAPVAQVAATAEVAQESVAPRRGRPRKPVVDIDTDTVEVE